MTDKDCEIMEAPETPIEEPPLENLPGDSPPQQCNIDSSAIDDDTKEKLKGDQIGNTMYNQSSVIKTLMKFGNLDEIDAIWNEDFENELCLLWDITVEEDVCKFLFVLNFPAIACDVLEVDVNHRLIEILIGIIGNICTPASSPDLNREHLSIVLSYINSDDHLILIQTMRFIKVLAHNTREIDFITDEIMEKIIFILYNSMNVGLLEMAIGAIDSMTTENKLPNELLHDNLLEACFTAFKVIFDSENDSETDAYKTDVVKRNLNYLLRILVSLAVYCSWGLSPSTDTIRRKVDEHKDVIFTEMVSVLKSYEDEYDITESTGYVFRSIDYIFDQFELYNIKVVIVLMNMVHIITSGSFANEILADYKELLVSILGRFNTAEKSCDMIEFANELASSEEKPKLLKSLKALKDVNMRSDLFDVNTKLDAMMKICVRLEE